MKIAYVIIDCDGRDGTSVAMEQTMHRMAQRGHDVHLFSDVATGADHTLITWHRVRAIADPSVLRFRSFLWNCSRIIRKQGTTFDIVHSAGCNTAAANVYQIQNVQPAKRVALETQGEFAGGGWLRSAARRAYYATTTKAERRLYRLPSTLNRIGGAVRSAHFVPVSQGTARELQHHHGIKPDDITVIPNGVDLVRFQPAACEARTAIRASLSIADNELVLLFAGGEWRRKGLHHAIDALKEISADTYSCVRLLVVGRDAAKQEFIDQANRLGVLERITFAGFVSDTERYYVAADIFVFPTYYEAFSLATLEAAACGLPIVAAVANGTEELIRSPGINQLGENGMLVDRNGKAIAAAVNLLAADRERMRSIGRRSREIVAAEYHWDRIADRMEAVYRTVVDRERNAVPC